MPTLDTLIIPEQVTISGDVLYKALVDLEAVEDILLACHGNDTPLMGMISNATWTLFQEAFGEPGEIPDVDSGLGAELYADGQKRADEWFNRSGGDAA
jgi:hypothetical protein